MNQMLVLFLFVALAKYSAADIDMSGPSVGSSGIGIGKTEDGAFKFVDTKTQRVLGDLNLGKLPGAEVHASWNKPGTRVEVLVRDANADQLRLYEVKPDGTMTEIKFTAPDPVVAYEAKSGKPFAEKTNPSSDWSDIGAWTDDDTAWFVAGVTKELHAGGATKPTGTVTLFATFSVQVRAGQAQVAIESSIGPIHDNAAGDRRTEFLQNWELRNAVSDSMLQ